MKDFKKIIILAPHADDGEFGCGATINKLCKEGKEVWYVAFSPCKISIPKEFPEDILYQELDNAAAALGIDKERIVKFDFDVRHFPAQRQAILEEMIQLKKQIQPDLVIMPNSNDIHQDHHTIYEEGLRAFKGCSMLGYELIWNNLQMVTNFHVSVSEENVLAKWNAIDAYKSQTFRNYKSLDFARGLAQIRGVQIGVDFAEAFETIRIIA
jgi:LmbE family N-acetylglucosaminyl deacetylase